MKKVQILMATFNGERYLKEQLDSLILQKEVDVKILISDDGSKDATVEIIKAYQKKYGNNKIDLIYGPQQGFMQNFLNLLQNADRDCKFYSFSDQDDIWCKDKLKVAITQLDNLDNQLPSLYCSRTELINANGFHIGYSPRFKKRPDFKNALVQSIAGGNTMVFNQKSYQLLKKIIYPNRIVSHDWWVYLIISGAGGRVIYDPQPKIFYRQHGTNLVGANNGLIAKIRRFNLMMQGRFKSWNDSNIECLVKNNHLLTSENQKILQQFIFIRNKTMIGKIFLLKDLKLYRQTLLGNFGLYLGFLFNKV
jgi:glycosyltransferase involved in cell wall biosynthesis